MSEKYSIKQYNTDRAKAVKALERADTYIMAATNARSTQNPSHLRRVRQNRFGGRERQPRDN